jgi:hypothetical protein
MQTLQVGPSAHNFLRFERVDSPGFTDFSITAHFDSFTLVEDDLLFDRSSDFLTQLSEFERTRKSSAVLTALPQFTLTVAPHGSAGHAWVSYRLSRSHYIGGERDSHHRRGTISIEAGFDLPGELVAKTLEDFRHLLQ